MARVALWRSSARNRGDITTARVMRWQSDQCRVALPASLARLPEREGGVCHHRDHAAARIFCFLLLGGKSHRLAEVSPFTWGGWDLCGV